MQHAFALRAEYDDYAGGQLALPDGTAFDVLEALERGDGVIVTDDLRIASRLREYPPLKEVAVPERPAAVETTLDDMTKEQLLALPEAQSIDAAGRLKKPDLVEAIRRERESDEAGATGPGASSEGNEGQPA